MKTKQKKQNQIVEMMVTASDYDSAKAKLNETFAHEYQGAHMVKSQLISSVSRMGIVNWTWKVWYE